MINKYLLTASTATAETELTSFDKALLLSRIGNYNLVKVSSILPAKAKEADHPTCVEGSVLFTAFAQISSNEAGKSLSAAVAVGIPKDNDQVGVIMEFSCYGRKDYAEKMVSKMVKEAMCNRNAEIGEILIKSSSVEVDDSRNYFTAFAAVAMWEGE